MPSTIQGLVVLFLAVLPGFVTVAMVRRTRPARESSPFDAVVWCVVYSAIIDTILVVSFSFAAKWYFKDDFAIPFRTDLAHWLAKYVPNHLRNFGIRIGAVPAGIGPLGDLHRPCRRNSNQISRAGLVFRDCQ